MDKSPPAVISMYYIFLDLADVVYRLCGYEGDLGRGGRWWRWWRWFEAGRLERRKLSCGSDGCACRAVFSSREAARMGQGLRAASACWCASEWFVKKERIQGGRKPALRWFH